MVHLSEILIRSSAAFRDRIALDDSGLDTVSYHELNKQCLKLKEILVSNGIDKGDRIGLFIPKSTKSVIAIFSAIAADTVYVPVDSSAPVTRAAYIFNDCQAKAILIDSNSSQRLSSSINVAYKTIPLIDFGLDLLICSYNYEKPLELPENLAYILYTSGSTGTPKGVLITHLNAICFIEWAASQFNITENHVFSSIAPFHFDLSIFDLFVSLKQGAKLVLFNQKAAKNPMLIAQTIAEKEISIIYATPTLLKLILNYGKCERYDHSCIQKVLFAGEVFAIDALKKLKEQWSSAQFYNLYGPTETNVVTWFKIPDQIEEDQKKPFPIGQPCPYAQCKIWDEGIIDPFIGAKGELLVSGDSVVSGYLNLPEKNKQAFVYGKNDAEWYKTGDVVEIDDGFNFVFVGRIDRMIKKNGYRIELAEIEAALNKHSKVGNAGVIAFVNKKQETKVKAFITQSTVRDALTLMEIRQFCLDQLPMYMLPDYFVFIEDFPKTSSHKIDYQKLKYLSE